MTDRVRFADIRVRRTFAMPFADENKNAAAFISLVSVRRDLCQRRVDAAIWQDTGVTDGYTTKFQSCTLSFHLARTKDIASR